MNEISYELVSFTEFTFRLTDHGENRWVKSIEFKVLAINFEQAITAASMFVREHSLIPSHFSIRWRAERDSKDASVYTGSPE